MQIIVSLITHNRPRTQIIPSYLTIHNTGNDGKGADAKANRSYFDHTDTEASAHWIVDDKVAINCVPETEMAWHTGTKEGNMMSIGMEVCENRDGDWDQCYRNAVDLAADILHRHRWPIDRMRTHKSWSGKNCPRKLLPIWDQFVADVKKALAAKTQPTPLPYTVVIGQKTIPAKMIGDKLWAPVRDVAETLGKKVTWDGSQNRAIIS